MRAVWPSSATSTCACWSWAIPRPFAPKWPASWPPRAAADGFARATIPFPAPWRPRATPWPWPRCANWATIRWRIEVMPMRSDCHTHITLGDAGTLLARLRVEPFSVDDLLRRMDAEGIDRSVVLPVDNPELAYAALAGTVEV